MIRTEQGDQILVGTRVYDPVMDDTGTVIQLEPLTIVWADDILPWLLVDRDGTAKDLQVMHPLPTAPRSLLRRWLSRQCSEPGCATRKPLFTQWCDQHFREHEGDA